MYSPGFDQIADIMHIPKTPKGGFLCEEMGLGKTLTALLAARAMVRVSDVRVMVVAPVGLHAHWRHEASVLQLEIDLLSLICFF